MIETANIYDKNNRLFTIESADLIVNSISKYFDKTKIQEVSLLKSSSFSDTTFLETKGSLLDGSFTCNETQFDIHKDILLFYQVITNDGRTFGIAHRDPFEIYYNEAIMWVQELPSQIKCIPEENILFQTFGSK